MHIVTRRIGIVEEGRADAGDERFEVDERGADYSSVRFNGCPQ